MLLIFVLLAVGLSSIYAQRAPTFVGCAYTSPYQTAFASSSRTNSAMTCAIECSGFLDFGYPKVYSYFYAGANDCSCATGSPGSETLIDSSGTANPDLCAEINSLSVYRTGTTFVFDACYASLNGYSGTPDIVQDMDEAFTACRGSRNLFLRPFAGGSGFQYICLTTETFDTPTTCGAFDQEQGFFIFSHSAPAASAQLSRKRKRSARARGLVDLVAAGVNGMAAGYLPELQQEYCPEGLTACKVSGSKGGYECIDTLTELESCGGCMYGQFGLSKGVAAPDFGTNCADLDVNSSIFGSKTCSLGQCVDLA